MNKKIKITAIQEPAIRYITTDGEKFEDPIRAEDHQFHEPTGKPVGLIFKINLIGTTCKTDRILLALSE